MKNGSIRPGCLYHPGFQSWSGAVEGGVEQLAFATIDHPQILDEWHELGLAHGTRAVELLLETDVDYLTLGGSGTMRDVDLAEVKRARGGDIALMGNLHTTEVMLRGTADEVYDASVQAIRDAGPGGGFVLSTGDQCGPGDTGREPVRVGQGRRGMRSLRGGRVAGDVNIQ